MNEQQREKYWKVFDNFRQKRELAYAPKIARALRQQKAEFIEKYKQGHLIGMRLDPKPLQSIIKGIYLDAGVTFGHKVLVSIKGQREQKARMPIGFNEQMQQLIEDYLGTDFLTNSDITDTTRDVLQKVLIEAQKQGLGFDDTLKLLGQTDISQSRARMIARTETVGAANVGAHLSAKSSGILVKKVWIATMDNRTRHDHSSVSSEAIDIDAPFQVGEYEMLHPGVRRQPDGRSVPGSEIINCRCVEAFQAQRDASGRVLTT